VANSFLPYQDALRRQFAKVIRLAANRRYQVLACRS
jgi:16S rRNA G1207 methylase RsmC